MKRLLIARHGSANSNGTIYADFDRTLTSQGEDEVNNVAIRIKNKVSNIDKIIVSSAIRAISTAKIFATTFEYPLNEIEANLGFYERGISYIIDIIATQNQKLTTLLIVGHNPVLSSLSNHLLGEDIISMPAGSVVCIDFEMTQWSEIEATQGKLTFFEKPYK